MKMIQPQGVELPWDEVDAGAKVVVGVAIVVVVVGASVVVVGASVVVVGASVVVVDSVVGLCVVVT
jgi:hypothetical protein